MVQRLACVLLAEYRTQNASMSSGEIADCLGRCHPLRINGASIEKEIARMIERGSYYRSLERALGVGVTLALGTQIAETT